MSRGLSTLALGLLLAVPVLVVPTASAAGDERHVMPRTGGVTIVGHGFGHGHGMSQYGAQGAAKQGLSWQQIVDFYYPGTQVSRLGRKVKVLISGDTTSDVVVSSRRHLFVKDLATREKIVLPDNGADRWRLKVNRRGRTVLQHHSDRWRRHRTFDGDAFFSARGRPLTLHLPSGTRSYRGKLLSARPAPDSADRDTVNILGLDKYIRGVIPHEMPPTWEPQAVRAQAVAARTYAAYERAHPRARHYQICDTTACQVYGGRSAEHPASNAAVRDTRKVVLTRGGEPAFTQFSSSSGGWTAANQFDYLPAQEDPYDGWAGNPVHTWRVDVDVARLERTFGIQDLAEIRITDRDGNGEWGGRVNRLELRGTGGKVVRVSGDMMRFSLGLRSRWFTLR